MKRKILFVIGSLQLGGAETVLVDLLNSICDKFEITLLLVEKRGPLLERLDASVKLKYICLGDEYSNSFFEKIYYKVKMSLVYRYLAKSEKYVKRIYKRILKEKYSVEVAFLSGIPASIVKKSPNKNSKKIAWIHAEVTLEDTLTYNKYKIITSGFDEIIGVSERSIKTFENTFPETKSKIKLINNYVDTKKIINLSKKEEITYDSKRINCISVGRLCYDKAFDRIINMAKKYEDKIVFNIIGDGPDKEKLLNLIKENGVKNVKLLGLKSNPYPYIKNADFFLLSSRSEAYPTVVIEAMVLDKDIIATDVPGVGEILNKYIKKIIVPNKDESIEYGINEYLKNNNRNLKLKANNFEKTNNDNLKKIIDILQ